MGAIGKPLPSRKNTYSTNCVGFVGIIANMRFENCESVPVRTESAQAADTQFDLRGANPFDPHRGLGSGEPWSLRLKALLPLWMLWIKQHFRMTALTEQQLLRISPRQIDHLLQAYKRKLRKRIYRRTNCVRYSNIAFSFARRTGTSPRRVLSKSIWSPIRAGPPAGHTFSP